MVWCGAAVAVRPQFSLFQKIIHWRRRCLSKTLHTIHTHTHTLTESSLFSRFPAVPQHIPPRTVSFSVVKCGRSVCVCVSGGRAVFASSQTLRIFAWQILSTFVDFFLHFHSTSSWLASSDTYEYEYIYIYSATIMSACLPSEHFVCAGTLHRSKGKRLNRFILHEANHLS